ncbi:NAD-dependent epimerase/dehydratase family protein [Pedobacter sp. AW1-32]|uniref:NAD-dependent epimerase/dehydratase family protein n=1 Tax=Pedobacter sp. AW1-32 TaxID=3383026 RepID=UPI003FEF1633
MHTILGAGGPTANALTAELIANNEHVRLVSRRAINYHNENVQWMKGDLLNQQETIDATKGSAIIYMCAGLVYDTKIWQEQWPIVMQNIIAATKASGARLIFFDNVYMYGLVKGEMCEDSPNHPSSKKGEVRAKIAEMLMKEVAEGTINATIARAADFYGTESTNSFFDMMVLSKYAKKESAQWIGNPKTLHNFTYIPDTGKALYLLAKAPESANQIWHLPTAKPLCGEEFIQLAAEVYGVKPKFSAINKTMLWLVGLFKKVVAGTVEMYYQYENDYNFNSDKFEKKFNFEPTSYRDGIMQMSKTLYKKQD